MKMWKYDRKVPMLQNMHEYVLEIICSHLEPLVYKKDSYVVKAGEPLGPMIFILAGKIIMTDTAISNAATRSSSEITETCDENVVEIDMEALILKAEDLRSTVSKCGTQWNLNNNNSQYLVGDVRDIVANTSASTTTDQIEQTVQHHQGHDLLLEQLVLIRETMSQLRDDIVRRLDDQGQRLDDHGHRLDNQRRRLDEMAAFLAKTGYKETSPLATAP
ncbi:hypothetical protein ACLB2K_031564 [Fragaria x ananassa]